MHTETNIKGDSKICINLGTAAEEMLPIRPTIIASRKIITFMCRLRDEHQRFKREAYGISPALW